MITLGIYLFFVKLLNVSLPAGWLAPRARRRRHLDGCALNALLAGFGVALQPMNLLWGLIGVTLGTAVGVLPGVGPALTVAMLLPLTAKLDPTGALIMFAGIYYGAMFGGSTTTILLNTPGESASIATALEGNKMAKAGRAGPALATSAIGSFVAGTIATVLLTLLAPIVVDLALKFGPAEYFALMVFAFITVAAVLGSSTVRGLTSLFLGLLFGLVGIDSQTGQQRFAFGVPELLDGIDVVVLAVGLFAVGEALYVAAYQSRITEHVEKLKGSLLMSAADWKRSWPAWLRATAIGFPFGTIPAGGAEIPTFLSYATEKKLTKHPGGIRQGRDRGRRRAGGGEQRRRHRRAGAAAHARHPDLGDRRDPARRVPELRPAARPAAVRRAERPGVGPDREPLRRQRDPADPQPAADRHLGEGAARSRRPCSTPASWCSPRSAPTACTSRGSTCSCSTSSACSASPCAAGTSPSARR